MSETAAILETIDEAYAVDPELCIACDACCQDFPEVFFMGDDEKAHALDTHPTDKYNAREVIDICPTAAISFSGEVPDAEDLGKLKEVPGWELEWARWRDVTEDRVERDRRYGRDYSVEYETGLTKVTFRFPTRVPAVRDRFKYGLPTDMPMYRHHVSQAGNEVFVAGWLTDPKVRALTHTSKSFPSQFMTTLELDPQLDYVGSVSRYDGHAQLEIVLFTDAAVMESFQWKAHFITDKCTACTICERVCPTNAITGGDQFFIDPDLCINCSVCGVYCPFDAIDDNKGELVQRIKAKQVPKALVHDDLCTGCEYCVDVCPFEALVMVPYDESYDGHFGLPQNLMVAKVIDKNCVSCKLCEQVCIKDAIEVPRSHQFEDIGMSFMSYLSDEH
ncbi:MAG: electron transport complex protein RnfB [Planctomycetota bacterium]|jgi:electron transport complex protein RnfB